MPPKTNRQAAAVFRFGMKRILKKHKDNTDGFIRQLFATVALNVIGGGSYGPGTPVDTGFARASWRIGLNRPGAALGSARPNQIVTSLAGARAGDKLILSNNTKYIRRLEYGHSQQAPQGMVRVVFMKVDQIAKDVSRSMKK